ncbi:hypothetical protein V498_09278, partial [Pseudogymnoascus sp. VKM F-4517 (FW-2822)]
MKRVHQRVPQPRALHHRLAADEVRAAPHGDGAAVAVLHERGAGDEGAEVVEPRGAVRVGEDGVGAAHVAQAVRDGAAFAAVAVEGDDAEGVVEGVGVGEFEGCGDGAVCGAVVDDEDFVACWLGGGGGFRVAGFGGRGGGGAAAVGGVE